MVLQGGGGGSRNCLEPRVHERVGLGVTRGTNSRDLVGKFQSERPAGVREAAASGNSKPTRLEGNLQTPDK